MAGAAPAYGLVRTRFGHVLLDAAGMAGALQSPTWSIGDARRAAVARCGPGGLRRMLKRHLPNGSEAWVVGHMGLDGPTAAGLADLPLNVLLHDTIPLDHPAFADARSQGRSRAFVARVAHHAARVIHPARATRAASEAWLEAAGRMPPGLVAPLGVAVVDAASGPGATAPTFVALGTIEPRKNHALLLDLWEVLAREPDPPRLVIAGARGWLNRDVFARLDARPACVSEMSGLADGDVARLIDGAAGLLHPSLAEGFGLAPCEAAARGVPVLAGDLCITREILGDYPVYAAFSDRYAWLQAIREMAEAWRRGDRRRAPKLPTWDDHFNIVLTPDG